MRKLAKFRRLVAASAGVGLAIIVTAIFGFDRVALALVGLAVMLVTALLFMADHRSRERLLPRSRRSSKTWTQLDAVEKDVRRVATTLEASQRRLAIDLEETQRRLVVSIETLRLEGAERDRNRDMDGSN